MQQQTLDYQVPLATPKAPAAERTGFIILSAFLLAATGMNIWVYREGIDKLDVIAAAISSYVLGPVLNGAMGVVVFVSALVLRKRRGRTVSTSACLVASVAVPIVAFVVDIVCIQSAFP